MYSIKLFLFQICVVSSINQGLEAIMNFSIRSTAALLVESMSAIYNSDKSIFQYYLQMPMVRYIGCCLIEVGYL